MDYSAIDAMRDRHPAWRLLRSGNATLILSFLGNFFVEGNRGGCPASEVAAALGDYLYALNAEVAAENIEERFPKEPRAYLEDWAATDVGYLRRYYPPGDDDVHYEITPAFEKAYAWVTSLQGRSFVGTESRLQTVVELLRQIVRGTEVQPDVRLAELHRRRDEIDAEITAVESGVVTMLDATAVRDRYQQLSATARELLSDFREVEENFRLLDRAAREKIAAWDGSKGELLAELVGSRSQIAGSDQGRSFGSFYEFLLSESRQVEIARPCRRLTYGRPVSTYVALMVLGALTTTVPAGIEDSSTDDRTALGGSGRVQCSGPLYWALAAAEWPAGVESSSTRQHSLDHMF